MTPAEFTAVTRLLQGPGGTAREAARLVLVEGLNRSEAARQLSIHPSAVGRAVARIRALAESGCPTCGRRP